ncbi:MAG: methyltransferase domain-containing protein [Patescibacteria group bacterium]|jgi:SAM-dependent methyltransferase
MQYYFWATYRRKLLDQIQNQYRTVYRGTVLDIGGRDRGNFVKPKNDVLKWIFADIDIKYAPDILLDVTDMPQIQTGSIDVVNAIELFEHVNNIEAGLRECSRVLKTGGNLILSAPFLFPVHADPFDYQRWTEEKWRMILRHSSFSVKRCVIMGTYFLVWGDMTRSLIKSLPFGLRHLGYLLFPFLDLITKFDSWPVVKNNNLLNSYHGGYFIVAEKK